MRCKIADSINHFGPGWPLRPRRAIGGHHFLGLAYLRKTQLRKIVKPVTGTLFRLGFASGLQSMPSGLCLRALQLCGYGEDFGYCMGNLPIFVISMGCI